jgi:hypothetical protein
MMSAKIVWKWFSHKNWIEWDAYKDGLSKWIQFDRLYHIVSFWYFISGLFQVLLDESNNHYRIFFLMKLWQTIFHCLYKIFQLLYSKIQWNISDFYLIFQIRSKLVYTNFLVKFMTHRQEISFKKIIFWFIWMIWINFL